ncbi:unnamed protein product [Cylicostephanus goldi]|uniref:Uncharacterized protein n=1 Tax=Cylicostephanus goldi TaxID=71465 RepID=A0A3P6RT76_CYLGO|nr:unnamed protein product [Cylicostephanus goldi]
MFKLFTITITLTLCVASTYGIKMEVTIKPSGRGNCNEHTESSDKLIIDFISIFETDKKGIILSGGIWEATSEYHIVLHVRAKKLTYDDGIFYYYTESTMKWHESEDKHTDIDDTIFHEAPFLPGHVMVKLDGKTVINVHDRKDICYNMYSWIPQHGMYRLDKTKHEWIYMFYYPVHIPSVLS